MHVVFRTDASTHIGTGHVMRCLTLADALVKAGHTTQFICRRHENHLGALIEQRGYRITLLEPYPQHEPATASTHADWLGTSWQNDARDTIAVLRGRMADWLVVDHYALDSNWEQRLRPHTEYIMAIDDLADRSHDVDLLLDQNFYADMHDRYLALIDSDTETLIGPQYAMLREEFIEQRDVATTRNRLEHILIFFGGIDQHDLTSRALQAIQQNQLDIAITVIVGDANPHAESLRLICDSMHKTECHRSVDNMAELMVTADLAIGAGGTTTWERCYLGLPAIVATIADNQTAVNEAVASAGAAILAGGTDTSHNAFATILMNLIDKPDTLSTISEAAFSIMQDHVGSSGVVAAMENIHG